ncbi:MAG: histone H1 [Marinosulfonomonas sp.]|nr:MAG: histone H1 [Marinosulfonomonas sp.]
MTDKPKRPRDANQLSKMIVDVATGEVDDTPPEKAEGQRRGGLKGGKARAAKLSPEERSEIAKVAAMARWKKSP